MRFWIQSDHGVSVRCALSPFIICKFATSGWEAKIPMLSICYRCNKLRTIYNCVSLSEIQRTVEIANSHAVLDGHRERRTIESTDKAMQMCITIYISFRSAWISSAIRLENKVGIESVFESGIVSLFGLEMWAI